MTDDSAPDGLLATLTAERAIRRLLSGYCDAVGRRDLDAARTLFAPDCRVQIADLPVRNGIAAQCEALSRTFSAFSFLHQRCDTSLIDVTSDSARGRISVFEINRSIGKDELNFIFGTYEDAYVRLSEGWRFKERRFTIRVRATLPVATLQDYPDLAPAFAMQP